MNYKKKKKMSRGRAPSQTILSSTSLAFLGRNLLDCFLTFYVLYDS